MKSFFAASCLALTLASLPLPQLTDTAAAAETNVAVAANFTAAAKEIATAFEAETGHTATLSFGSTGKIYTQIANGAPFTVFLAADQARPEKAEAEGLAVAGSRFTYASGKIVLYSVDAALVDGEGAVLKTPDRFERLAIANPKTAPYGAAAVQAMEAMQVPQATLDKIVQGDSISQTHQFVATGNAQLGFVALSQVIGTQEGSRWIVPADLYTPIHQDAVLLKIGKDDEAAKAFITFLKGDAARVIIESYGYGVE